MEPPMRTFWQLTLFLLDDMIQQAYAFLVLYAASPNGLDCLNVVFVAHTLFKRTLGILGELPNNLSFLIFDYQQHNSLRKQHMTEFWHFDILTLILNEILFKSHFIQNTLNCGISFIYSV